MKIEEGVELARFTTLGTGGPARAFAPPEKETEVEELLRWGRERALSGAVVGLGSNLRA
jgi:UDP-N-acetylenolpyruvoylglucosamine reductase